MAKKVDLDKLVANANFADSSDNVTQYTGIPSAIDGLPAQYYWLINNPRRGAFGVTKVAVFDPKEGISSLRVYHFSETEMNRAQELHRPMQLARREPMYAGEAAVKYLTSRA